MFNPAISSACLDLDRVVDDLVALRTISGAEDLLAPLNPLDRSDGRVTCRVLGTLRELRDVRLFSSLAVPLADVGGVLRSAGRGVISALTSDAPLRFRIAPGTTDAGVLRIALTAELGWIEDPSDWVVNFIATAAGWEAEIGPFSWSRRFGRLERLPWSTKPVVGEILARLAKISPGQRILDPCCGTGTLLIAAAHSVPGLTVLGSDHDPAAIRLADLNLTRCGVTASLAVAQAEQLDYPDHGIDRLLANLPFGKLVGSHANNSRLYPALLSEIARVLDPAGRAVLLTDDKRLFLTAVARTPNLKIVRTRVLRYSGVTPTVYILTKTRRR
ncbi:MAG TPA: methyltransferase domain-containing protein [Kribbella sp.]|uniref:TRM11 family SAM-dependent methyltransferase n=1 Tax=Kribbella sp. TaxID=1871183 RepID=UPI002D7892D2|nr:methyltransferase domain-containing protein [Kribbella sp.]HET6297280.1 methyltransferase domain-containing protein [Kribbella sp.]